MLDWMGGYAWGGYMHDGTVTISSFVSLYFVIALV